MKTLTRDTRIANSRFFGNDPERVRKLALTVGVGTVNYFKDIEREHLDPTALLAGATGSRPMEQHPHG